MDISFVVLHTLSLVFLIFAVPVNVCFARESVWGLQLTQASYEVLMCHAHLRVHQQFNFVTDHGISEYSLRS